MTGGPGTGKTEVIIQAAVDTAADGCRVLIVGPMGPLVDNYRNKLPPNQDIVTETSHTCLSHHEAGGLALHPARSAATLRLHLVRRGVAN